MDEKDLQLAAAIILAGIIAGEGNTNDLRSVKRAVDTARKLQIAVREGIDALERSEPPNPAGPSSAV